MAQQLQDNGLSRLTAALLALPWWLQWGVGNGADKTANAVTTTGTTEARVAATVVQGTKVASNDTIVFAGLITALAAVSISEVGVFDSAGSGSPPTGGTMDVYADFSVMNLRVGDSLNYTIKLTFS